MSSPQTPLLPESECWVLLILLPVMGPSLTARWGSLPLSLGLLQDSWSQTISDSIPFRPNSTRVKFLKLDPGLLPAAPDSTDFSLLMVRSNNFWEWPLVSAVCSTSIMHCLLHLLLKTRCTFTPQALALTFLLLRALSSPPSLVKPLRISRVSSGTVSLIPQSLPSLCSLDTIFALSLVIFMSSFLFN